MSRIGKLPVHLPQGVTATVGADNVVLVKGPLGQLWYWLKDRSDN